MQRLSIFKKKINFVRKTRKKIMGKSQFYAWTMGYSRMKIELMDSNALNNMTREIQFN